MTVESGSLGLNEDETDVLIVGAGPTGMALAIELERRGVDHRLVEKNDSTASSSRALGINPRTLQVFEDMGLLEDVLAKGFRLTGQGIYRGEEQLVHLNTNSVRNDTDYPYLWVLPQYETEEALLTRLTELGGEVEFEAEVAGFQQESGSVRVRLVHSNGTEDREEVVHASYLVGCDGGSSMVRKTIGLDFSGDTRPETFFLADVSVTSDWPSHEALTWFHEDGIIATLPIDGEKTWRVFAEVSSVPDHERPEPTPEGVHDLLTERTGDEGTEINDVIWSSEYTVNQRMVGQYRTGSVFLAGDAAHVHSPFGAMGMNTGIQDAYNLGWKLALVVSAAADAELLDTYDEERRPVAEEILGNTGPSTGLISSTNPLIDALREHVLSPILERERVQARLLSATTQLGINYRESSLSRTPEASLLDELFEIADLRNLVDREWRTWRAPKAGDRLLDGPCEYPDGSKTSIYDLLHGETGFALLLFAGTGSVGDDPSMSFGQFPEDWGTDFLRSYRILPAGEVHDEQPGIETVIDRDRTLHRRYGAVAPVLYVIRPDDYIGFRAAVPNDVPLAEYLRQIGLEVGDVRSEPRKSK
jgi:2-polyprenyl-6-methoxyphenol hydroxylase-like FAD-dependent oxidoreductase